MYDLKHNLSCGVFARLSAFATAALLFCSKTQAQDEFFETYSDGSKPQPIIIEAAPRAASASVVQPKGGLSGRVVFAAAGHGWTWNGSRWTLQRGVLHEMNEDYGNLDQLNFFADHLFHAGATIVPLRPVGHQTNEVVLDNTSTNVRFSGAWFNSKSPVYFGRKGVVPYKFAPLANIETATAIYTPRIPTAGFYPVYTWVRHGPDRTSQLYRILHSGGETQVRVPHHLVGNGWVYLGTYYFERGFHRNTGSVVISNLQPTPRLGAVVIADAIRFGNGMGTVIPAKGAPVSGYPREEEASLYWVAASLGHGQPQDVINDLRQLTDNVGAPTRFAREMNREAGGDFFKRVYISFHSNAGGGRGAIGLFNDPELFPRTETPSQKRLAELIGVEVNDTLSAIASPPLEVPWFKRNRVIYARDDYAFGEINNQYIRDEFNATILEVAFHDNEDDALLMRDPKVRDMVARCSYRAVVRYFNEFDQLPLAFLPEPPRNVRAVARSNSVEISWGPAPQDGAPPSTYVIYQSKNGRGFGKPIYVSGSPATVSNPSSNEILYFRVAAVNEGGESLPSATVACRLHKRSASPTVLLVNGFTEFDRSQNARQTPEPRKYVPPGAFGTIDRVSPPDTSSELMVNYGNALVDHRLAFDSCDRTAIAAGNVDLAAYAAVIWAASGQPTNLFTAAELGRISEYMNNSGTFVVSGAHLPRQ